MTITNQIEREIKFCETELAELKVTIAVAEAQRRSCIEKLDMLNNLLASAQNETSEQIKDDIKTAKLPRKKKTPADTTNIGNNTVTNTDPEAIFTMKDIAHDLNVDTNTIAKTCTELGYNNEMIKNNYKLTREQMIAIRSAIETRRQKEED